MNILVFSWRDIKHPMAGGAEQVDHEHHKGWIAGGHSVTLFSSSFGSAKREEVVDGVRIVRRGKQLLGVQVAGLFWYLLGKHAKFDLVVDEFHGIPFFTPLYIWNVKKLAVIQEVARDVWLKNDLPKPFNLVVGLTGYIFEPIIFLFYKRVHFMTASKSCMLDLVDMGIEEKKISIIPHGIILDLPKRMPKKEKITTITFLGALAKDKGIEDAIRCFSILKNAGKYQFWVMGKAGRGYDRYLTNMAKNLGVEVYFWGGKEKVNDRKKFELLARSHVLVNPSLREGFGLVNIEANAVGTPVVAYNSPGLTDSVKNGVNGVISRENTPESLSYSVIQILEDGKKYLKLQKSSIEWSRKFSWEASRKMSLELIEKMS